MCEFKMSKFTLQLNQFYQHSQDFRVSTTTLKGQLSDLRQFLAIKSPDEKWFISSEKIFLFSRYLSFYHDFWVMQQHGLIRKINLISNFMTSQPG